MLTFSRCTKELSAGLFMRILDQMFNEILSLPFPMDRGHTQHHSITASYTLRAEVNPWQYLAQSLNSTDEETEAQSHLF